MNKKICVNVPAFGWGKPVNKTNKLDQYGCCQLLPNPRVSPSLAGTLAEQQHMTSVSPEEAASRQTPRFQSGGQHLVGEVRSHGPPGGNPGVVLAMRRPDGMGTPLHLPQHQPNRTPSKPPGTKTRSLSPSHPRTGSGGHSDPRRLPTAIWPFQTCLFPRATTPHPRRPPGRHHSRAGWSTNHTPPMAGSPDSSLTSTLRPTAMAPFSAEQLAGLQLRTKCVWWPRPPRPQDCGLAAQIASPLALTLRHTCHTHVVCV